MASSLPASAAELIRSAQKDAFFMQTIRSKLLDIVSEIFGPYSARYEHEIDLMAKLLYFVPTVLFTNGTLGEEYCSIQAMANGQRPTNLRKLSLLICAVGVPYFYNKIRKNGRTQFIRESWSNSKKNIYKVWNLLLPVLLKCDKFISFVLKFHLFCFYFYGKTYEFAKYIVGIKYVYVGNTKHANNSRNVSYSGLGRLIFIQFLISVIIIMSEMIKYIYEILSDKKQRQRIKYQLSPKRLLKKTNIHLLFNKDFDDEQNEEETEENDDENGENDKETGTIKEYQEEEEEEEIDDLDDATECVLCLSPRRFPTVTECGHIFCWNCIADWCTTKVKISILISSARTISCDNNTIYTATMSLV